MNAISNTVCFSIERPGPRIEESKKKIVIAYPSGINGF